MLVAAGTSAGAEDGLLVGEDFRYDAQPVLRRVLADLVAIPADVPRWSAGDAAQVAVVLSSGVALMLPPGDPPDVRLDRWIRAEVDPRVPTVWNDAMQPALWGALAAGGLGTWWWAATHDRPGIAQGMSLMGEALAVAQVYHVSAKLLVGREGPRDGSGTARILGPGASLGFYPGGTPSGHAATLFSLASAGCAYFEPPGWAVALAYGSAGALVLFHVADHRHYLSDVVLGAGLGHGVGRWVVLHRASPGRGGRAGAASAAVVPFPLPGGAGVAVAAAF